MKKIRHIGVLLSMAAFALLSCGAEKEITKTDQEVVTAWADMTLYLSQYTPANSPTYASRCVGYIGLTMYESVVHGFSDYQSLNGQLNDLPALPKPAEGKAYDWVLSLNAAQAFILKNIYNQTSDENKLKIDSLQQLIEADRISVSRDVAARSSAYGRSVAELIFDWSKTDGGHRAYLNNFDKDLVHPIFPGSWKPPLYAQSFSHHPLHPHWGENRTFLTQNSNLELPYMIPYDTVEESAYFQQFVEVYQKDLSLTQAEKEAALWWGDDPDDTFTPPGHSFYLANKIVRDRNPTLIQCAETYAKVGMAVADAFTNCWKWKYHFFTERPNTFIPKFIDQEWVSFWPDPPFPAFPSGHAINGAACTTILIDLYGPDFSFIDSSHVHRKRDKQREVDFVPRSFNSFEAVSNEIADSRFYGGIHTRQDNAVGIEKGKLIGNHVSALAWKTEAE